MQRSIGKVLPSCHLRSAAIDCSCKSRIRDIRTPGRRGPRLLRSSTQPRELSKLSDVEQARVESGNECSDFLPHNKSWPRMARAAFSENPGNSLHSDDPVEAFLLDNEEWHDFEYYACVLLSARKKFQRMRHNIAPHPSGNSHFSNAGISATRDSGRQCKLVKVCSIPAVRRTLQSAVSSASLLCRCLGTGAGRWSCPALGFEKMPCPA